MAESAVKPWEQFQAEAKPWEQFQPQAEALPWEEFQPEAPPVERPELPPARQFTEPPPTSIGPTPERPLLTRVRESLTPILGPTDEQRALEQAAVETGVQMPKTGSIEQEGALRGGVFKPTIQIPNAVSEDEENFINKFILPEAWKNDPKLRAVASAAFNIGKSFVEFGTSPGGAATPIAVAAAPRATAGAFAADMAANTPAAAREAGRSSVEGNLQEKIEGAGNLAVTTGLGALLGAGAVRRAPVAERAPEVVREPVPVAKKPAEAKPWEEFKQAEPVTPPAAIEAAPLIPPEVTQQQALQERVQVTIDSLKEIQEALRGNQIKQPETAPKPQETLPQPPATEPAALPAGEQRPPAEVPTPPAQPAAPPPNPPAFDYNLPSGRESSIRNRETDVRRVEMGIDDAVKPERKSFKSATEEADFRIQENPLAPSQLIEELKSNPRTVDRVETELLRKAQNGAETEFYRIAEEINKAHESGNAELVAELEPQFQRASDANLDVLNVIRRAGTDVGRALAQRANLAAQDYSLARMVSAKRAANGGRPLTPEETQQITELHKKIVKASEDYSKRSDYGELQQRYDAIEQAFTEYKAKAEAERPDPVIIKVAERIVKGLETRADAARKRLQGKLFSLSPDVLKDLAEIGASHIARLGLDFTKWSARMIEDIGDRVKPHLQKVWDESQKLIDTVDVGLENAKDKQAVRKILRKDASSVADITEAIRARMAGNEFDTVTPLVQRMARQLVASGVKDRDALIDAVHAELQKIDPEITRRDAMDAISGYGQFKQLPADEVSKQLRDLKGQMQQLAKIEDMQAGTAPQKTGIERRSPSDTERRLIAEVNELKKKGGFVVQDPAKALQTALDTVKKRLENQIKDLETQVATKTKLVKERRTLELDAEAKQLQERRDELKKQFDEIFGERTLTIEQRLQLATKAAERSAAEYERRIKEGEFGKASADLLGPPNSPELVAARARRDALKAEYEHLRDLAQAPAKEAAALEARKKAIEKQIAERRAKLASGDLSAKQPKANRPLPPELEQLRQQLDEVNQQIAEARKGPAKTPEEIAIKAYKARTAAKIAELQERIANQDFAPRQRKELDISQDVEAMRLKGEAEKYKAEFQRQLQIDQLKKRSTGRKVYDAAKETLNLSRNLMTSWDVSAVLRQGGFITIGNPARAFRSLGPMFRALASDTAARTLEQQIVNRPNAKLYDQSKLYIAPLEAIKLTAQEEAIMSRLAGKIPGIRASNRAYVTFLNKLRADSFDAMADSLAKRGKAPTPAELEAIANYINVATGRGDLGKAAAAAETLATVFFSPRLLASRFQLLAGQPLYRGTPETRRLIATEYGKLLTGLGVIYALGTLAGGEIETDPRSSDFGKIRFGNTRVDPMAGLAQVTTFVAREASGETKSVSGRINPIRGDVPYGSPTGADVAFNFARSKLSPALGAAVNVAAGQNMVGEKVTPESMAKNMLVPLSFQDIADIMEEQGVPRATALEILNLFGMSVQHYERR